MKLGLNNSIKNTAWNPTMSRGLEFWFAKGTEVSVGGGVSAWRNIIATGESWSQATVDNQPTLVAASDYAIDFDGNDVLTGTQYTFTGEFVIGLKFTVEDATAANDVIIGDMTTAANFIRLNNTNTIGIKTGGTQGTVTVTSLGQFTSDSQTHLVATRDSSNVVRYWIDGVLQTNTVTKSGDFLVDSIGARSPGTNYFSGKIWEVIGYKDVYSVELAENLSRHLMSI